jgi:hypothetical protein
VCFKNGGDRHLPLAGELLAGFNARRRIEHCRHASEIIPDQIEKLGDPVGLIALKNGCHEESHASYSLQVHPRRTNSTNNIGIGIPKAQSIIHPTLPFSLLRMEILLFVIA